MLLVACTTVRAQCTYYKKRKSRWQMRLSVHLRNTCLLSCLLSSGCSFAASLRLQTSRSSLFTHFFPLKNERSTQNTVALMPCTPPPQTNTTLEASKLDQAFFTKEGLLPACTPSSLCWSFERWKGGKEWEEEEEEGFGRISNPRLYYADLTGFTTLFLHCWNLVVSVPYLP